MYTNCPSKTKFQLSNVHSKVIPNSTRPGHKCQSLKIAFCDVLKLELHLFLFSTSNYARKTVFSIFYSALQDLSHKIIRFEKFEDQNFADRAFFTFSETLVGSFAGMYPRLKMISGLYFHDLNFKILVTQFAR